MDNQSDVPKWKLIVGGLIVAGAFAIMMPGVFDYIGRIGRVILLVAVTLAIALTLVLARHKLMPSKSKSQESVEKSAET